MIKVGIKLGLLTFQRGFIYMGLKSEKRGRVEELIHSGNLVEVRFDGFHTYVAYTDWKQYLESVRNGNTAILLVEKVEDIVEENLPWFKTPKGIEWLYKNFPEAPNELRTYRHGQVFLVNGVISGYAEPYMLVSCVEVGSHTMVNLNTGRCLDMLPYTEEVTYSEVSEMFGGLNFSLVADSVEEYFKE